MLNHDYQPYMIDAETKKKLAKLAEYEATLLSPGEIKKLVADVVRGNTDEWQKILFDKVQANYEEMAKL